MSTPAVSDSVENKTESDFIVRQIDAVRGRIRSTDVMTAVVTCGILLTGYLLLFTIADHWLIPGGFSAWTRAALLTTVLVSVTLLAWKVLVRPLSGNVTALYAATTLDRESVSGGALVSLIDLQQAGAGTPERVHRTIEGRARSHLRATSLDDAVDRTQLIRMSLVLFGLILATCLYSVLSPKPISLLRSLTLVSQDVATRTRIANVDPGNVSVPLGEIVEVTADVSGVIPESVQLFYTTADRGYVDAEVTMEATNENGRFAAVIAGDDIRGIRQLTEYRIQAGDALSESFTIHVDIPPAASVRQLHYVYPKYTQLPATISVNPNIDAWEGSTVVVEAESNVPVVESFVEMCADRSFQTSVVRHPMAIDETTLTSEFRLEISVSDPPIQFYRVTVQDAQGLRDLSPTVHTVNIQPDAPPVIRLLEPVEDLKVPANATVPLLIYASDPDFLLRSVSLHYEINRQPVEPGERIYEGGGHAGTGYQKTWTGIYNFELSSLELQAGDVVSYQIRARDNRYPWGAPTHTPPQELHIQQPAGKQQLAEDLKKAQKRQERMLDQLRQEQEESEQDQSDEDRESKTPDTVDPPGDESDNRPPASDTEDSGDRDESSEGTEPETAQQVRDHGAESSTQQTAESSDGTSPNENTDSGSGQSQGDNSESLEEEEAIQRIVEKYLNKNGQISNERDRQSGNDTEPTDRSHTKQQQDRQRTPGQRSSEPSPSGTDPPSDNNSESNRTRGDDPDRKKSSSRNPAANPTGADHPGRGRTSEGQSTGDHTDPEQRNDPSDKNQTGVEQSTGKQSDKNQTGVEQSTGKQSEQNQTGVEQSTGKQSEQNQTGEEQSTGKQSEQNQTGEDESTGKQSEQNQTGEDESTGEQTKDHQTGADELKGARPGEDGPRAEQSRDDQSNPDQTPAQQRSDDPRGDDQPGKAQSATEQRNGNQSDADQSRAVQPNEDDSHSDQPNAEEQGAAEQGGEQSESGSSGGSQPGGDESGGAQPGTEQSEGGQSGGEKPGGKRRVSDRTGGIIPGGSPGPGSGNSAGTTGASDTTRESTGDELNLADAARATDLAIRRLEHDIERGNVDDELLEQLGWTPERLREFSDRMRDQLKQLDSGEPGSRAEMLQRRRTEALLESLDFSSMSSGKTGSTEADREQLDTVTRRQPPPAHLRARHANYLRRIEKHVQENLRGR